MPDTPEGRITLAVLQEDIQHLIKEVSTGFEQTNRRLDSMNGMVRDHDRKIAILEAFCADQIRPALEQLGNLRLDFAKAGLYAGGGLGTIGVITIAMGKLFGWW